VASIVVGSIAFIVPIDLQRKSKSRSLERAAFDFRLKRFEDVYLGQLNKQRTIVRPTSSGPAFIGKLSKLSLDYHGNLLVGFDEFEIVIIVICLRSKM
jgi:hypothetical protein